MSRVALAAGTETFLYLHRKHETGPIEEKNIGPAGYAFTGVVLCELTTDLNKVEMEGESYTGQSAEQTKK